MKASESIFISIRLQKLAGGILVLDISGCVLITNKKCKALQPQAGGILLTLVPKKH